MAIKIAGIMLISVSCALAQYNSIYIGPNSPDLDYDKTRHEIVQNFLNNKPLLNYVPVYNTEYGHWEEGHQKSEENTGKKYQTGTAEPDFEKFGQVINRLKTNMQNLSHKTKHIYEDKLKELSEVKKLYDNLKVALQNTDALKTNLQQNQKQLIALAKNQDNLDGYHLPVNPAGVEQFLKAIEGLESIARNINYKYDRKPGM